MASHSIIAEDQPICAGWRDNFRDEIECNPLTGAPLLEGIALCKE